MERQRYVQHPGLGEAARGSEALLVQISVNPVRESMHAVVLGASHVKINYGKLQEFAALHAQDDFKLPIWDAPVFLDTSSGSEAAAKEAAALIFVGDSINFQFTYLGDGGEEKKYGFTYKGVLWEGAFGMWAALKNAIESGVPMTDAGFLSRMTREELEKIFETSKSHLPMAEERLEIFHEVGRTLAEKYESSFWNIIEATRDGEGRARIFKGGEGLVERLVRDFPSFRDAARHHGTEVALNKRAQLTAIMVYEKLLGAGIEAFPKEDVDALTVAANYELPKMLRKLGILEYSEKLADKVDRGIQIPYGSEEEVEIRAMTIYASSALTTHINASRPEESKINALHMDYLLWSLGRSCKDVRHHYTTTIAY